MKDKYTVLEWRVADKDTLVVNTEEGRICINCDDILYCESADRGIVLHMDGGRIITSRKLRSSFTEEMQLLLATDKFFRCHQSFCVSLPHIEAASGNELILRSGEHLPVAKARRKECYTAYYEWINKYGFPVSSAAGGAAFERAGILDRLGCAIVVYTQMPDGLWYLKYVNQAYCELMQASRYQILQQAKSSGLYNMVCPLDVPKLEQIEQSLADGQHLQLQYRLRSPENKPVPGLADIKVYQKEDGCFLLYIAYMMMGSE